MPATLRSAVGLGLALLAVAAAPTVANASTLSGKVAGAKLPKGGKGFSTVRAVRAKDLVIVAVDRVQSGRYKLNVPAGTYWLLGSTTPLRGKAGVDPGGAKVTVRKGKRKTVGVSLRKRKQRRPKLPRVAHAAYVNVKYPAVWVQHFSTPGDLHQLRRGLASMLIEDLPAPLQKACNGVLVEREKLNWIIAEQLLSQSRHGDPSTRIPTEKMIGHNREVSGSLTVAGATMTLTVVVKNVATGTSRSVSRSAPKDRFFELEKSVIQETVRLICGDKPPAAYSGQVSSSTSFGEGTATWQTLSWSGNVRLKHTGEVIPETGDDPPGGYALYAPESGGIHATIDGADGGCTYHGETDVSIVPIDGSEQSRVQQGVDEPSYALSAAFPPGTAMSVTKTGSCPTVTFTYPLDGLFVSTLSTQRSASSTLVGTETLVIGGVTTKASWSLAPQAS